MQYNDTDTEDFIDYLTCPSCGSNVAVMESDYVFGEVAHCKHDCRYRWYMLIEPDPETFYSKHPYKKILDSEGQLGEYDILGHDSQIIPFTEDLEDIYYEDKDRYNRILKYSDFNNTLIEKTLSYDTDVPFNLPQKRMKFFERYRKELAQNADIYHSSNIIKFINREANSFDNFIYTLVTRCKIKTHYSQLSIFQTEEFNKTLDKSDYELQKEPDIDAITYNNYQKSDLLLLNTTGLSEKEFLKTIQTILGEEYGISFVFIKPEYDNEGGCKPITQPYKEIFEDFISKEDREDKEIEKNLISENTDTFIDNEFFNKITTYNNFSIAELHNEIKEDCPIAFGSPKPFIIPLNDFYKDFQTFINIPSLIDFDNQIAFMSISHKDLIQTLNKITFQMYLDNNGKDEKSISKLEYEEYSHFENTQDLEDFFHAHTNTMQIFTSIINEESPKMLTFHSLNSDNQNFLNMMKENNIKFDTITKSEDNNIFTLNGHGIITGEAYFPKPDEENIPAGKILIIPTASEEYFLPSISNMDYKGCIITEKGSRTSHLIINSKEFKFNICLLKNASKILKDGDVITLDLDKGTLCFN